MKRIYGVQCAMCKKRMFSFHVHYYKTCGCPNNTMVDGGREYLRFGWKDIKPKGIYWTEKKDGKYPYKLSENYRDKFPY